MDGGPDIPSFEEYDLDDGASGSFMMVDEPDVAVRIAQDDIAADFVTLSLGRSWKTSRRMQGQC
ncbi:hypothetical protein GGR58DRAFT_504261 [Xylaria digitata]|nr:hypothetical protein GGR58DRAFT_504261 [Xylaria digitata]